MRARKARSFVGIVCVLIGLALFAYAGVRYLMVRRLEEAYQVERADTVVRESITYDPAKMLIGGILVGGGSFLLLTGQKGRRRAAPESR